jgi:hypothetical protein
MAERYVVAGLIRHYASRGGISRFILDILRQAPEPVTSLELTLTLLVTCAQDHHNQELVRFTKQRIDLALRYQRRRGHIRSIRGTGQWLLWEIDR